MFLFPLSDFLSFIIQPLSVYNVIKLLYSFSLLKHTHTLSLHTHTHTQKNRWGNKSATLGNPWDLICTRNFIFNPPFRRHVWEWPISGGGGVFFPISRGRGEAISISLKQQTQCWLASTKVSNTELWTFRGFSKTERWTFRALLYLSHLLFSFSGVRDI
jgi:hypothetical protein